MSSEIDEAMGVLAAAVDAWNASANTWNAEGISRGYATDAVFFGGRPGMQEGPAGVSAYFASYVGVIASANLTLRDQRIFRLGADVVIAQGFGHFALRMADGRCSEIVQRTTLVLVKRFKNWKIMLHHFSSVPPSPPLGVD